MAIKTIEQQIKLNNDGGILKLESNPTIKFLKMYYFHPSLLKNRVYAINKMDLLKLGESGNVSLFHTIETDDFFQHGINMKEHAKLEFHSSENIAAFTRNSLINKKEKSITLKFNQEVTSMLLNSLRIQRSNIKINNSEYIKIKEELTNIGFSDDVASTICFKLAISPVSKELVNNFNSMSIENFINRLQMHKILNPSRYGIIEFIMREKSCNSIKKILNRKNIISIKDMQEFIIQNPEQGLKNISGFGDTYNEIVKENTKTFLNYCY